MTDIAADNLRLRKHMKRIIAERELATSALRMIVLNHSDPVRLAAETLDKIAALPMPEEGGAE